MEYTPSTTTFLISMMEIMIFIFHVFFTFHAVHFILLISFHYLCLWFKIKTLSDKDRKVLHNLKLKV